MKVNQYQASIEAPFAHLGIRLDGQRLAAIDFIDSGPEIEPVDELAAEFCRQIRRYLTDQPAHDLAGLACSMSGTAFQKNVWRELRRIPSGTVLTYGEIASKLGTSARAVGNACRHNPIPVVVPCHRVIAAAGIGGYAGDTAGGRLNIKTWLLQHEGVSFD